MQNCLHFTVSREPTLPKERIDLRGAKPKEPGQLNIVMQSPLGDGCPNSIILSDGGVRYPDSSGRLNVSAAQAKELAEAGWRQVGVT